MFLYRAMKLFPVAKTCRFRFPLKELRREAREDLAPPWVFIREVVSAYFVKSAADIPSMRMDQHHRMTPRIESTRKFLQKW